MLGYNYKERLQMKNENGTGTIEVIYLDGTSRQITYPWTYFEANLEFWQDRFSNGSILGWKVV
jgi:DNA/RNA endonuclease YhcR with UshA esterase domain